MVLEYVFHRLSWLWGVLSAVKLCWEPPPTAAALVWLALFASQCMVETLRRGAVSVPYWSLNFPSPNAAKHFVNITTRVYDPGGNGHLLRACASVWYTGGVCDELPAFLGEWSLFTLRHQAHGLLVLGHSQGLWRRGMLQFCCWLTCWNLGEFSLLPCSILCSHASQQEGVLAGWNDDQPRVHFLPLPCPFFSFAPLSI